MRDTVNARFVQRLQRREPLLGTLLSLPSPEIAEIVAGAGFDWLFIDLEHGLLDFADAQHALQAASALPCIVRVPANRPADIGKVLDAGAAGVIVPHVNTPAEARAAVMAAKYPPEGERSIGAGRAQGYGRRLGDELEFANTETVVVPQAEHIEAVRQIGEILRVPGVDAIFVGPFDLSGSLGKPGAVGDQDVRAAIAAVEAACVRAGKPCGIFLGDAAHAREAFAAGHSLVCVSTDAIIVGRALQEVVRQARA